MTIREKLEQVLFYQIPQSEDVHYELFVGSDIEITLYTTSGSHHIPLRVTWNSYTDENPKSIGTDSETIVAKLREIVETVLFDRIVLLSSPQDGV